MSLGKWKWAAAGPVAAAVLIAMVVAQTAPAPLAFEVASIRPTDRAPDQATIGVHIDGAQVHIIGIGLKEYVRLAYRLKYYQIDGPAWMAGQRYDISATLPAGATADQVPDMLQTLLANRFKMTSHTEMRDLPVFALMAESDPAKLKLKHSTETDPAAPPGAAAGRGAVNAEAQGGRNGVAINLAAGGYFALESQAITARHITMPAFADTLSRFLSRPVVDRTGLGDGVYDLDVPLSQDDYRALLIQSAISAGVELPPEVMGIAENAADTSLFSAVRALGLRLESSKAQLEVRVIDHINQTPTPN